MAHSMTSCCGTFNDKLLSVTDYFGAGGRCHLHNVKEFYALSIDKKIVYVRFLSKKAKFTAETQIKSFKTRNPDVRFNVARPNIEKFSSDIRQSQDEIRYELLKLYTNSLITHELDQYIPLWDLSGITPLRTQGLGANILGLSIISPPEESTF